MLPYIPNVSNVLAGDHQVAFEERQAAVSTSGFQNRFFIAQVYEDTEGSLVDREYALSEVNALCRLPGNWDGDGATPINEGAIEHARGAIQELIRRIPAPEIVPNVNGTISLEWETDAGYAHLEVASKTFSFLLKIHGSSPIGMKGSVPPSYRTIADLIGNTLYGSRQDNSVTKVVVFTF